MIAAGIDEAGYGPVFGPLVVAGTAFRFSGTDDLWHLLSDTVSRAGGRKKAGKILVDDSKKVYRSASGKDRLKQSVCAFLDIHRSDCASENPGSGVDGFLPPEPPWYMSHNVILPETVGGPESEALRSDMRSRGVTLPLVKASVCFAEQFNKELALGMNKAELLFTRAGRILRTILGIRRGAEECVVIMDRQGGRIYYLDPLRKLLPEMDIQPVQETAGVSEYRAGDMVRIIFRVKADQYSFSAALASMVAKFVRELYVEQFNAFWQKHIPDLKPTAGYPVDAARFFRDIESTVDALGIENHTFMRNK